MNTLTEIAEHISDQNIQTKLFTVDGEYRVRVRDLDAKENITIVICKTLIQAQEKFNGFVETIPEKVRRQTKELFN